MKLETGDGETSVVDDSEKVKLDCNPAIRCVGPVRVLAFHGTNSSVCMQNNDDRCKQGWLVG